MLPGITSPKLLVLRSLIHGLLLEGTSYPNAYLCGAGPDFGSVSFLLIAILWNRADLVTETEGAGQKGVHLCMHLAISSATVGTAEVQ